MTTKAMLETILEWMEGDRLAAQAYESGNTTNPPIDSECVTARIVALKEWIDEHDASGKP